MSVYVGPLPLNGHVDGESVPCATAEYSLDLTNVTMFDYLHVELNLTDHRNGPTQLAVYTYDPNGLNVAGTGCSTSGLCSFDIVCYLLDYPEDSTWTFVVDGAVDEAIHFTLAATMYGRDDLGITELQLGKTPKVKKVNHLYDGNLYSEYLWYYVEITDQDPTKNGAELQLTVNLDQGTVSNVFIAKDTLYFPGEGCASSWSTPCTLVDGSCVAVLNPCTLENGVYVIALDVATNDTLKLSVWADIVAPTVSELEDNTKTFGQLASGTDTLYYTYDTSKLTKTPQVTFALENVENGHLELTLAPGPAPFTDCTDTTPTCSTTAVCFHTLQPCELEDVPLYIAIITVASGPHTPTRPITFTITATAASVPAPKALKAGTPTASTVVSSAFSPFTFSSVGGDDWLVVHLYIDTTGDGGTLYISNSDDPLNAPPCYTSDYTCTVTQASSSCTIPIGPCSDITTKSTWYATVQGAAGAFYGVAVGFTVEVVSYSPVTLEDGVVTTGTVYPGGYSHFIVPSNLYGKGTHLQVNMGSVTNPVNFYYNFGSLAGAVAAGEAECSCYQNEVGGMPVTTGSYILDLVGCAGTTTNKDIYIGIQSQSTTATAAFTLSVAEVHVSPVTPKTLAGGVTVSANTPRGPTNYYSISPTKGKPFSAVVKYMAAPGGTITMQLYTDDTALCMNSSIVSNCVSDGNIGYCAINMGGCEVSGSTWVLGVYGSAGGLLYNLAWSELATNPVPLTLGTPVAASLATDQYALFTVKTAKANPPESIFITLYVDEGQAAQASLLVDTDSQPGLPGSCYNTNPAYTCTGNVCKYFLNPCDYSAGTYYISVVTTATLPLSDPLRYTLTASVESEVSELTVDEEDPIYGTLMPTQRTFYTFTLPKNSDPASVFSLEIGNVQGGSVDVWLSEGDTSADCPCFDFITGLSVTVHTNAFEYLSVPYCSDAFKAQGTYTVTVLANGGSNHVGYTLRVITSTATQRPLPLDTQLTHSIANLQYDSYAINVTDTTAPTVHITLSDPSQGSLTVYGGNGDAPIAGCDGVDVLCTLTGGNEECFFQMPLGRCAGTYDHVSVFATATGTDPVRYRIALVSNELGHITALGNQPTIHFNGTGTAAYSVIHLDRSPESILQFDLVSIAGGAVAIDITTRVCPGEDIGAGSVASCFAQNGTTCKVQVPGCVHVYGGAPLYAVVTSAAPSPAAFVKAVSFSSANIKLTPNNNKRDDVGLAPLTWSSFSFSPGTDTKELTFSVEADRDVEVYINTGDYAFSECSVTQQCAVGSKSCDITLRACCVSANALYYIGVHNPSLKDTARFNVSATLTEVTVFATLELNKPAISVANVDEGVLYQYELDIGGVVADTHSVSVLITGAGNDKVTAYLNPLEPAGVGHATDCYSNVDSCDNVDDCTFQLFGCSGLSEGVYYVSVTAAKGAGFDISAITATPEKLNLKSVKQYTIDYHSLLPVYTVATAATPFDTIEGEVTVSAGTLSAQLSFGEVGCAVTPYTCGPASTGTCTASAPLCGATANPYLAITSDTATATGSVEFSTTTISGIVNLKANTPKSYTELTATKYFTFDLPDLTDEGEPNNLALSLSGVGGGGVTMDLYAPGSCAPDFACSAGTIPSDKVCVIQLTSCALETMRAYAPDGDVTAYVRVTLDAGTTEANYTINYIAIPADNVTSVDVAAGDSMVASIEPNAVDIYHLDFTGVTIDMLYYEEVTFMLQSGPDVFGLDCGEITVYMTNSLTGPTCDSTPHCTTLPCQFDFGGCDSVATDLEDVYIYVFGGPLSHPKYNDKLSYSVNVLPPGGSVKFTPIYLNTAVVNPSPGDELIVFEVPGAFATGSQGVLEFSATLNTPLTNQTIIGLDVFTSPCANTAIAHCDFDSAFSNTCNFTASLCGAAGSLYIATEGTEFLDVTVTTGVSGATVLATNGPTKDTNIQGVVSLGGNGAFSQEVFFVPWQLPVPPTFNFGATVSPGGSGADVIMFTSQSTPASVPNGDFGNACGANSGDSFSLEWCEVRSPGFPGVNPGLWIAVAATSGNASVAIPYTLSLEANSIATTDLDFDTPVCVTVEDTGIFEAPTPTDNSYMEFTVGETGSVLYLSSGGVASQTCHDMTCTTPCTLTIDCNATESVYVTVALTGATPVTITATSVDIDVVNAEVGGTVAVGVDDSAWAIDLPKLDDNDYVLLTFTNASEFVYWSTIGLPKWNCLSSDVSVCAEDPQCFCSSGVCKRVLSAADMPDTLYFRSSVLAPTNGYPVTNNTVISSSFVVSVVSFPTPTSLSESEFTPFSAGQWDLSVFAFNVSVVPAPPVDLICTGNGAGVLAYWLVPLGEKDTIVLDDSVMFSPSFVCTEATATVSAPSCDLATDTTYGLVVWTVSASDTCVNSTGSWYVHSEPIVYSNDDAVEEGEYYSSESAPNLATAIPAPSGDPLPLTLSGGESVVISYDNKVVGGGLVFGFASVSNGVLRGEVVSAPSTQDCGLTFDFDNPLVMVGGCVVEHTYYVVVTADSGNGTVNGTFVAAPRGIEGTAAPFNMNGSPSVPALVVISSNVVGNGISGSAVEVVTEVTEGVSVTVYAGDTTDCFPLVSNECPSGGVCRTSYVQEATQTDVGDILVYIVSTGVSKGSISIVSGSKVCTKIATSKSDFCNVDYNAWAAVGTGSVDGHTYAERVFDELKAKFECPSPCECGKKLSSTCIAQLTRFTCSFAFPSCGKTGFLEPVCGEVCGDVEKACGASFSDIGYPQYDCGHSYFAAKGSTCTGCVYNKDGVCNGAISPVNPHPNNSESNVHKAGSVSGGAIAGIVIGSLFGVAVLGGLLYFVGGRALARQLRVATEETTSGAEEGEIRSPPFRFPDEADETTPLVGGSGGGGGGGGSGGGGKGTSTATNKPAAIAAPSTAAASEKAASAPPAEPASTAAATTTTAPTPTTPTATTQASGDGGGGGGDAAADRVQTPEGPITVTTTQSDTTPAAGDGDATAPSAPAEGGDAAGN